MNVKMWSCALAVLMASAVFAARAPADPLPGEILKFQQRPMIATPVGGAVYYGHDELSTALNTTPAAPVYQGVFMADDFADKFDRPVVHLRWWGSYLHQPTQEFGVKRFLISFESDLPVGPNNPFSRPDHPLLSQVVALGPLAPASGTFTEKLIRGPDPVIGESLFEYNAELACPFPEQRDTVYWLKIVALVDPQQDGPLEWGWHNRDYTIFDPLASAPPAVVPGEHNQGPLPSGEPIWHFQDDAVTGNMFVAISGHCEANLEQSTYAPTHYQFPTDGPDIIQQYSKDLAFELYTVPEPTTLALLTCAALGLVFWGRRFRRN